jgi:tetratricopeptide (TPR) repeat protein
VLTRPQPEDFRDAADAHILAAVAVLQDRSLPGTARLDAYAQEAEAARSLYAASLEGRSYQPLTVARLAALRFELSPPLTEESWADWLTTVQLAGRMAPRIASVHASLGELLVRMGRAEEGLTAYAHALELDPRLAQRAVSVLEAFGVAPEDAVAALPRTSSLLLTVRRLYQAENRLSDYAELLEPDLPTASPDLLAAWADARLAGKQADLVVVRLAAMAPLAPSEREAARCVHLSRAYLGLGDAASAMQWAARARAADPTDARALEQSANAALASNDAMAAVAFAREALTALARRGAPPGARARIYEIAGSAEERRGRMDAAHDAYSRAVALDPNRTASRQRLDAMRAAAGLAVPSESP